MNVPTNALALPPHRRRSTGDLPADVVAAVVAADWHRLRRCLDPDCSFEDPERAFDDAGSFLRFEENARAGLRDWELIDAVVDGETVLLVQRWGGSASGPYHKLVRGYTRQ